jgi:TolB-like protein
MADGLTEEMIGEMGRQNPARLGVIARTSVMHYKGSPARIGQIGRELGVQYLLEGSVREQGDTLRVSAQLIRVRDETHTWARQYDRQLTGLVTLQREIAQEISDEVQIALGEHPTSHPVKSDAMSAQQSEAYDLYLKGLYFWNKKTTDSFWRAIEYYQQAIANYPNHAPSYAGIVDCYAMIGEYSAEPRPRLYEQGAVRRFAGTGDRSETAGSTYGLGIDCPEL